MNLSLRFILPLFFALTVLTYSSIQLVDQLVQRWSQRDLDMRADLMVNLLSPEVEKALAYPVKREMRAELTSTFERVAAHERIYALGYCDSAKRILAASAAFPFGLGCGPPEKPLPARMPFGPLHTVVRPVSGAPGSLVIVLDTSYLQNRYKEIRKYIFYFFAVLALVVSLITTLIAQLSWRGWLTGMRSLLLLGDTGFRRPSRFVNPEIRPIVKDLRAMMRQMEHERAIRDEANVSWTPQALREILQNDLAGEEVLIVSNREPYIHVRGKDGKIAVQFPASGLVSALEPVMRACSGTWIAHGSGSADRDVVDAHDHVPVPPGKPAYDIRRVWLSPEEEKGYYYGFANEGIWPLSHVAHTRPIFRTEDWEMYRKVNEKFARTVIEEAKTDNPVILVQDYHFALLPRLIRERLPQATVIMFWHIPWPNPEAFGICPWREEILHGMLGSSILGFHTRFHCNNFIDSVDRFREARIDRETSDIASGGHFTAVRHYPISIEWPPRWLEGQDPIRECRRKVREEAGIAKSVKLGIGVDRLDYTKGILERFQAVERLLDLQPEWRGMFSFLQIASPSRSVIEQYREFERQVREEADRINLKFGNASYRPIILRAEHHTPFDVFRHFRAADLCFVSSLHDGMNLVAKEFVSAREDEQGVLILSQFTGASRELPEALIINPYDVDQCAAALKMALTMSPREQQERMRSMRSYLKEFNVYRWAGRMLIDAARMRQKNKFQDKLRFGA
ncbi:MAG TPA: trehalose-6-phosphate synthase [Bdellovibrionota bacterium]|jgi:trehalose 6-phosphate synthase